MAYFKTHSQNLCWETIRNHKVPQAMIGSCWTKNGIQDLVTWSTYVNHHMGHSVNWTGHFPLKQQFSAFLQNDWFSSHVLKISQCDLFSILRVQMKNVPVCATTPYGVLTKREVCVVSLTCQPLYSMKNEFTISTEEDAGWGPQSYLRTTLLHEEGV